MADLADHALAVEVSGTIFDGFEDVTHWRKEVIARHGLKPEILEIGYSTRDASCRSTKHPRTEHQTANGITPVMFDPQCIRKPLLWHD